ncbi:MAG: undecaprenyl-diphosphate phosphatase [Candidatus Latescibacteria bacterium]|nr:undecaprenyl-diphosphate phosphatase [Candidatus Latescibacterota bacterium]
MVLTAFEAALLGIIQGLTEFLPVSSSGHLALGQALLGIEAGDVTFEIIVHFGTLLAVVTALRERIMVLVRGCLARDSGALRMLGFLILGTIPAAVFGIGLKTTLEEAFASPAAVSGFLIVTGVILWTTRFASGNRKEVTLVDAVIIGCAQACAIFPGISRSGTTIGMGLWRGLDSREAGTFSFLLSIPIILGATILAVDDLLAHPPSGDALWTLIIGAVAAYVSGLFAIRWLMRILAGGKLERFAYYCWIVGIVGVGYFWS